MTLSTSDSPLKKSSNSTLYLVCALLLLLSNGVLAWRVWTLQASLAASVKGVDPRGVLELLDTPLSADDGRQVRLAEDSHALVVLFAFTPDDCGPCLSELSELNALSRQDAAAFALMSYASPDEARQTRVNFNIDYPILLDPEGGLLTVLKPPKTPWKIVIDRRNRRILYEDPPSVTDAEREAFLARLSIVH